MALSFSRLFVIGRVKGDGLFDRLMEFKGIRGRPRPAASPLKINIRVESYRLKEQKKGSSLTSMLAEPSDQMCSRTKSVAEPATGLMPPIPGGSPASPG